MSYTNHQKTKKMISGTHNNEKENSNNKMNNVCDCYNCLTCFINYYNNSFLYNKNNEKTYSERKQELKQNVLEFLEMEILQANLRALYFHENFKENWTEIRNLKILIAALNHIVKFIDNPTYGNLDHVKWLANEFDYSDKILYMRKLYNIFRPLTENDNLGKAIIPMIKEILKGFDSDSESESESESEYDDVRIIIPSSDSEDE